MMNKNDILKWKSGFETSHEIERRLIREDAVDCERSIRLALSLIDICHKQGIDLIHGRQDQLWEEEVERVRERWRVLRKAFLVK